MITAKHLHGIFAALPTPIHPDGTVHAEAVRTMVRRQLEAGSTGLVPIGGTGEYGSLSTTQREAMVRHTAEASAGRLPVIAGILDPGYPDALAAGRRMAEAGADALMVVTPYYTNPTPAGVRDYFLRYADESPVPLILYEIPYRTRIAIAPEVHEELSRHERIIGMKACNLDMYHFLSVLACVGEDFAVLSGEDSLLPLHLMAGGHGGIVVTATLVPRVWNRLFHLVQAGQHREALMLHRRLMPLMNLAFAETNPGPMKAVLDLVGPAAPDVLAPLAPPQEGLAQALRAEVQKLMTDFGETP
ncbi:4-hydroxy-tetrahydrodipicolinate synthase [Ottowia thiooxydans]|uniref:4-hydroxy-tetrahydrodipicolinate synthase n=1 Tax=Ottowia thiooxydans TaxID=219182 RepID=UPI00040E1AE4|nr:4-hydroxy-tetrahydrodipicolinate synthase [Ottowia thiooxydans]